MTEFIIWTKRLSTIGAAEGTVGTGRGARGPPLLCARARECADAVAAQHGVGEIGAWTRQTRVNQWRRINSGERSRSQHLVVSASAPALHRSKQGARGT